MVLSILRAIFILLIVAVTVLYVLEFQQQNAAAVDAQAPNAVLAHRPGFADIVLMMAATVGLGGGIIVADMLIRDKNLGALSGLMLGLLAGLLVAYALSFVVDLVGVLMMPRNQDSTHIDLSRVAVQNLLQGVKVFIGLIACYISMSLVLQTKDDFRFVIPYIEFARQVRGQRPVLLDTSVIIDGRILDLAQARFLTASMIVPRFVLEELHGVADSHDKVRRARGRRGLETLQKLQADPKVDIAITDQTVEGASVDQRLVALAQELGARLLTNDFNLSKICVLRGIEAMNLNELAKAMRPVVLPGESMQVKIIKAGEAPFQGVGYIEDGTMVVVENARHLIGEEIAIDVTSTLQTSAGRMIFGKRGAGQLTHGGQGGVSLKGDGAAPDPASSTATPTTTTTTTTTTTATATATTGPDAAPGEPGDPAKPVDPNAPRPEDANVDGGLPSGTPFPLQVSPVRKRYTTSAGRNNPRRP